MPDVDWELLIEREAARQVAARLGTSGVPVSLRDPADAPGTGTGSGHWGRRVAQLTAAVERSAVAAAQLPDGGVSDQLDDVLRVLRHRLGCWIRIAEVGQALRPDDDSTDLDGTAPGAVPVLHGAAREIDERLCLAIEQSTAVAAAVEEIVAADVDDWDASRIERILDEGPAP